MLLVSQPLSSVSSLVPRPSQFLLLHAITTYHNIPYMYTAHCLATHTILAPKKWKCDTMGFLSNTSFYYSKCLTLKVDLLIIFDLQIKAHGWTNCVLEGKLRLLQPWIKRRKMVLGNSGGINIRKALLIVRVSVVHPRLSSPSPLPQPLLWGQSLQFKVLDLVSGKMGHFRRTCPMVQGNIFSSK